MGWFGKLFGLRSGPRVQPVSINDGNYTQEILKSEIPVVLDVWGPKCGPCEKLTPIILDLASDYHGRVKVCEMNAHEAPRTTSRLSVRGTPTVVYFRAGKELDRVTGFRGSLYHQQTIEELFGVARDAD